MYIPIFIAILMGLLSPLNQSTRQIKGSVYVKMNGSSSQPTTFSTDSIPPGEGVDDGGETGIGGGTGGENSPIIPPKPPKP